MRYRPPQRFPQLHDEEWLRTQYVEKRVPVAVIARRLGCSIRLVYTQLQQFGIPVFPHDAANFSPKWCGSCHKRFIPTARASRYCSPDCKRAGPADTAPPMVDLAEALRRETA